MTKEHKQNLIPLLCGFALGAVSFYLLYRFLVETSPTNLLLWLGATIVSMVVLRVGSKIPALSVYSLVYSLPITLASVSSIGFLLAPPAAGPAGGAAINAGIAMQVVSFYAPIIGCLALLSFRLEARTKIWYLLLAVMYLPALIPLFQVARGYGWVSI